MSATDGRCSLALADVLRSDARDNRLRILAAAREALARDPDVSLHAIAKAAHVGQGTLYRHFPNREALVLGLYREGIHDLVQRASLLLAQKPPLLAFRAWCAGFSDYGRERKAIVAIVREAISEEDRRETYARLIHVVRRMMAACQQVGAIVATVDAEDVLQLLALLMQLPATPEGSARAERLLGLMFRGLEAGVA